MTKAKSVQREANQLPTTEGVMLCTGAVAGKTYAAGCVITAIPIEVAQSHTNLLNVSAEAVSQAKELGAVVVQYTV